MLHRRSLDLIFKDISESHFVIGVEGLHALLLFFALQSSYRDSDFVVLFVDQRDDSFNLVADIELLFFERREVFDSDEGIDSGPVLAQETVAFQPGDTLDHFTSRIHAVEHRLYVETLYRLIT